MPFDGDTYSQQADRQRLATQLGDVYCVLKDHEWHTLNDILDVVAGRESGITARIRDLRKAKFGGYEVESKRIKGGEWAYRIKPKDMQGKLF